MNGNKRPPHVLVVFRTSELSNLARTHALYLYDTLLLVDNSSPILSQVKLQRLRTRSEVGAQPPNAPQSNLYLPISAVGLARYNCRRIRFTFTLIYVTSLLFHDTLGYGSNRRTSRTGPQYIASLAHVAYIPPQLDSC
jgi:hypothetical protein